MTSKLNTTTSANRNLIPPKIAFIDANIDNYQALSDGINQGIEVHVIDPNQNGIEQISTQIQKFAAEYGLIERIYIVSHGNPGSLYLGNSILDFHSLKEYSSQLKQWQKSLTKQANIFIYGCHVAADLGKNFIRSLSKLINANIAAATNFIGNGEHGSNWDLDFSTGEIQINFPFQPQVKLNYQGILATITVTNNNDSGAGSLRQAIAQAQAGDTITFAANLANQTITLTSGQLTINKNLTIDGAAAANLVISGNNSSRVFEVTPNEIYEPSSVTFRNLTIANGRVTGNDESAAGAGIKTGDNTTLLIENCKINNNNADYGGGGIFTGFQGDTTIINSKFDGNIGTGAREERGGGAIATKNAGSLLVQNSEFTNNKGINGGAINSLLQTFTVEDSIFKNNDTITFPEERGDSGYGGAIYTDGANASGPNFDYGLTGGVITIRNSLFEGNKAAGQGGALFLFAYYSDQIIVENSTIINNTVIRNGDNDAFGGGIRIGISLGRYADQPTTEGGFIIKDTTVANNVALVQGGGIWIGEDSQGSIINTTVSNNKADDGNNLNNNNFGGGIAFINRSTPIDVINSTVAYNYSGYQGGAFWGGGDYITLTNTLVANNTGADFFKVKLTTGTPFSDGGGNIQWPNKNQPEPFDFNITDSPNLLIVDPKLDPTLKDNGGGLLTHALLADSPAINAGIITNAPITDQRGISRDAKPDIGAFEFTPINNLPNVAPVANNENYNVNEDKTLTINAPGVLANDTDAENQPLTAVLVNAPTQGTLQFNPNGSFSYIPKSNFNGEDSFTYRAVDNQQANSNLATVKINVNSVNDSPILAANQTVSVNNGEKVAIASNNLRVTDVDNTANQLIYTIAQSSLHGTLKRGDTVLTTNSTFTQADINQGLISYTHDGSNSTTDQVTFSIKDTSNAQINNVQFKLQINPINNPPNVAPVANNDNYSVDEDRTLTINAPGLLANDTDAKNQILTAVLVNNPAQGTVKLNADGSFSYTPKANFNGEDSFTYRAVDNQQANSNLATVKINVNSINDPLILAANQTVKVNNGEKVAIAPTNLRVTDVDNTANQLIYTIAQSSLHGTLKRGDTALTTNSTFTQADIDQGLISYTHDGSNSTTDQVTFSIKDTSNSKINNVQFKLQINPIIPPNVAPVANNENYDVDEDNTLTINAPGVLANDTDAENQPLTAVVVNNPAQGTVQFNANGSFSYTPNANFNGEDSFTYRAVDNQQANSNSNLATVKINVNPVNDPPILAVNQTVSVNNGEKVAIAPTNLQATDVDNTANELIYNIIQSSLYGTLKRGDTALNANSTFTQADLDQGLISYTHNGGDSTTDQVSFFVTDIFGTKTQDTQFNIQITKPPITEPPITEPPITEPQVTPKPPIQYNQNNIFIVGENPIELLFSKTNSNGSSVNELNAFTVDDEQGRINGILPFQAGYLAAAVSRSQSVFSALESNLFDNNGQKRLSFQEGDRLSFFLVADGTTEDVKSALNAGQTPSNVLFAVPNSNQTNLITNQLSNSQFILSWEDNPGDSNKDFTDLVLNVQTVNQAIPIDLVKQLENEVLDLRSLTGLITAEVTVNSEAAFNNYYGFYTIDDPSGRIGNLTPGDTGYIQAALARTQAVVNNRDNKQTIELTGGNILAPFLVANGSIDEFLSKNPNNEPIQGQAPIIYFGFINANPDKVDHFISLGQNFFGVEDLFGGGDRDFDDAVLCINFSPNSPA
ncbi:MAG TPA: cadherin-like domain-containing protein [Nostocaceae cyanobacterium]|nr:cadherin-like domain-containing protein [Nostocaceae cyanobacterium]